MIAELVFSILGSVAVGFGSGSVIGWGIAHHNGAVSGAGFIGLALYWGILRVVYAVRDVVRR